VDEFLSIIFSMNFRYFILPFILLASAVFAYLPGDRDFVSLSNSNGVFGNPAGLSAFDSPGALLNLGRDKHGVYEASFGLNGDYSGASFDYRTNYDGLDESRWNLVGSYPVLDRAFFLGASAQVFRSAAFSGSCLSLSPGLMFRPFNWLSFGYTSRYLLSTGPEDEKRVQEYGATLRLFDGVSVSYDGENLSAHRMLVDVDVGFLNLALQIPLYGDDEEYRLYVSHAFGTSANASLIFDDDGAPRHLSFGYHSAKTPDPYILSRVVRVPLNVPLSETEPGFSLLGNASMSVETLRNHFDILLADKSAQLIIFDFTGYSAGTAISKEIERGILKLRAAGRKVVAYLDDVRPTTLLASSAADRVVFQPSARVTYRGIGGEVLYYKGFFDWVGIKVELLRHGAYKSAVEPYTADSMSLEARSNYEQLYTEWWKTLTEDLREKSKDASLLDSFATNPSLIAADAKKAGLADTVLYLDEVAPYALKEFYDVDAPFAMSTDYAPKEDARLFDENWRPRTQIALLNIEGTIVDGEGGYDPLTGQRSTGSLEIMEALKTLMGYSEYAAVILRINSPGGSAQASDEIWHRIHTISQNVMPVVATIGDMGASGGYYIACGANRIIAENSSIVGSIGIFGGKVSLSSLFSKLKLRAETVKTHEHSDAEGQGRAFTEEEKVALQAYLDSFYGRFLNVVSGETGLSVDSLDRSLAGGRVFTGSEGYKNGLIQGIGGLDFAISEAKRLAGISKDKPVELVSLLSDKSYLSRSFKSQVRLFNWVNSVEKTEAWALAPLSVFEVK